jgi:hypothetical protein
MFHWPNVFIELFSQRGDGILLFFLSDVWQSKSEMVLDIGLHLAESNSMVMRECVLLPVLVFAGFLAAAVC